MPTIKLTAQEFLDLDFEEKEAIKPYIIGDSTDKVSCNKKLIKTQDKTSNNKLNETK